MKGLMILKRGRGRRKDKKVEIFGNFDGFN